MVLIFVRIYGMKKEFDAKKFGDNLKSLRVERHIGQNDLARTLDLSNASISYWENGKQEPSASALFKLAQFFGVSVDYLIGLED